MKKILTLFAIVGMLTMQSCDDNDETYVDNNTDTISEVFELQNVSFSYNSADGYNIYRQLNPTIFYEDVILVYRLVSSIDANTPVWQQIPRTVYNSYGELDYDFDFSREDFTIYAGGNYDLSFTPEFLNNQTFRIVIVPGSATGSAKSVNKEDYSNYYEVIKKYNIDDSNVKVIK